LPPPKIAALTIRPARTAAELRAAAYLRAASFGHYPSDRSAFAARQHRRMRGDAEWEAVTAKVEGREPAYAAMRVACLIATAPVPSPLSGGEGGGDNTALAAALAREEELDPSASLLPSADGRTVEAVVGTLDVNVGAVLPAEELVGRRGRVGVPGGGGAGAGVAAEPPPSTRAYLSNVCVAKAARGQGVGKALLRAAEEMVLRPLEQHQEDGLLALPPARDADSDNAANNNNDDASFHLYVHVVHDNAAARALYQGQGAGFAVESEESEAFARGLARPRRLLLHKALPLNL
jgi:ribosomal protein S18 acetylase RimI-like enzyme